MTNQIRVFRAMKNLTQQDLADLVGVTRQTIIAIESNKYSPSLELAFKMVRVFGVKIEDVFQHE